MVKVPIWQCMMCLCPLIGCTLQPAPVLPDPSQDRIVAVVTGAGAHVEYGTVPGEPVVGVFGLLPGRSSSLAALEGLEGLPRLRRLYLGQGIVTHAHARAVGQLTGLEVLGLDDTDIGDAEFTELAGLTGLRELSLRRTMVTGQSFARLGALETLRTVVVEDTDYARLADGFTALPHLEHLVVYVNGVARLPGLGRLSNLRTLHVRRNTSRMNTPVGAVWSGDLAELAALPTLRELELSGLAISVADAKALGRMTQLRRLDLDDSAVADGAWPYLEGLTGLEALRLCSYVPNTKLPSQAARSIGALAALQELDLSGMQLTERELEPLGRLGKLRSLDLSGTATNGIWLKHLQGLESLQHVKLGNAWLPPAGMRELAKLRSVVSLDLTEAPSLDAGLGELRSMPALRELTNLCAGVSFETEQAWQALGQLVQLRTMRLVVPRAVPASYIKHLAGLAELRVVELEGEFELDADTFKQIRGWTKLEELQVSGRTSGVGIDQLAGLANLRRLAVQGCLTEEGLRAIAAVRHVRELDLSGTGLTDAHLRGLYRAGHLERLDIRRNRCGTDAIHALVRALPDTAVLWHPQVEP